jgi:hypothetical protein
MTSPHTVPGGIGHGTVLESCPSDADIKRIIDAAPPAPCDEERPPDPPHSSEIMEACEATRQSREANDMRSRRIVRQQWQKREGDTAGAPPMRGQMAIFDFKEGERDVIPHLPTHVKKISWKTARRMIEAHHYLGYAPCGCKFALGIYVETELMGTMIFGRPTARLEDQKNTLELTRMFLFDSPKNSESKSLGLAERWIKKNRLETRLISYTDTAQGHTGTIYKAANWVQVRITKSGSWIRDGRPNRRGVIGGEKLKFERIIKNKSKIPTTPPLTSYFGGATP